MSLRVVDVNGKPAFELKYGVPATDEQCAKAMNYRTYAEAAGGVDMAECQRILGRHHIPAPHRFDWSATTEIVLNWSR